ncbi:MAG: thiamine pyrophosphate-binding protein [Candidatus Rokuibacteriota bacterium]
MSRTTVADVLADGCARAGTTRVFVAPGGERALSDAAHGRGLTLTETRTGLGACVMGAVTGDLGEAPGVAVTSFGLGVAEGVACAARLRAPLLILTEASADAGRLAVKASLDVTPESAGHWIAHASRLAMTEPRGPVHLVLPPRVARAAAIPVAASCRPDPLPPPSPATLDAAAAAIRDAARPLVVAGRGCRAGAVPWLRAFAESVPTPVLVTPQGKGALADPHPLALGMLAHDHPLLARADLIVALGAGGDEIGTGVWPAGARLLEVVGDPALVLSELAERLHGDRRSDWDVAELDRIKRGLLAPETGDAALTLRRVVEAVREMTPAGTRATSDLPIASFWQAVLPGDYLADAALPGFGVAAAVAASLIDPARRAVAFTDAQGIAAAEAELATAEALGTPVIVVVTGADGASNPDDLRRAFDVAWRGGRAAIVGTRVAGSPR